MENNRDMVKKDMPMKAKVRKDMVKIIMVKKTMVKIIMVKRIMVRKKTENRVTETRDKVMGMMEMMIMTQMVHVVLQVVLAIQLAMMSHLREKHAKELFLMLEVLVQECLFILGHADLEVMTIQKLK